MENRWTIEDAEKLHTPQEELIYTSRLIGHDPELVVWGGGNSSVKAPTKDYRGRPLQALFIKASGSDMKTLGPKNIAPLDLDALLALRNKKSMSDDEMVAYLGQASLDRNAPRPSIETLLHAFIPAPHVYHVHADAICALTNSKGGAATVKAALGDIPLVPYIRPGFGLSKAVADVLDKQPKAKAVVLDHHGLITWGETAKEAYDLTISLVDKAEKFLKKGQKKISLGKSALSKTAREDRLFWLLPTLRGLMGPDAAILQFNDDEETLEKLAHPKLKELSQGGPATPDHLMHTRPWPLVLEEVPEKPSAETIQKIQKSVADWGKKYEAYTKAHAPKGSVLFPPFPRVVFVPGIGLISCGKNIQAARITLDIARRWLNVMTLAGNRGNFKSIEIEDIGEFEYWPMENYKLTLAPAEKPFTRQIVLIGGAAGAIGSGIGKRFHQEGAHVAVADIDGRSVCTLARDLCEKSSDDRVRAFGADLTREEDVKRLIRETVLFFGGIDGVVFNAGIAHCAPVMETPLDAWNKVMTTNTTSHFVLARESLKVLQLQNKGGWLVFVGSKNVYGPGKDFSAYSASKAALTQLARVLAVEAAPMGIRVNIVSPDGIFENSGLWSDELRKNRANAYKIQEKELEGFYRDRNLLKHKVTADEVAEAVTFLASSRASATTGAVLPVDGGVKEAFPR